MMAAYKLRTGDFTSDLDKVPKMFAKGKLSFLPKRSGNLERNCGRCSAGLKRRINREVRLLSGL